MTRIKVKITFIKDRFGSIEKYVCDSVDLQKDVLIIGNRMNMEGKSHLPLYLSDWVGIPLVNILMYECKIIEEDEVVHD